MEFDYTVRVSFWGGAIAQLGERLHGMQEVGGSIPPSSTNQMTRDRRADHLTYLAVPIV